MIDFRDVEVRFGREALLEHVTFRINAGERVGIVGPNGAGKSTIFRLILGEHAPDGGDVVIEGNPRIGYVRQHLKPETPEETLLEYSLRGIPSLHEMEKRIGELEELLATGTLDTDAKRRTLNKLGEVSAQYENLGGYSIEARVKESLGGLGYSTTDFDKPFVSFSGGWRMRAELSRVLASKPDLLLLDEPSNYLDVPAVEWLQKFLRSYEGTLALISHDRYLLRSLTRITIEVDGGTATRYNGPLDFYLSERDVRYRQLVAAKANQDRKIEALEQYIATFKAKAATAAMAQSRAKMLEKIERIKLPARSRSAGLLRIAPAPHAGTEIVRLEGVSFAYEPGHPVLNDVELRVLKGEKIAIVGYNGTGKTTLLRLLAGKREPSTGKIVWGHHVLPGYQSQEFAETMNPDSTVFELAKSAASQALEKDLRNILGGFGFSRDDTEKPAKVLSGGEKIRLAFLRLFLSPPNFLLLDEPTTHLDLEGRASLEDALKRYDGTLCFVSHDIEFVRHVADIIIEVTPGHIRRFPGNYDYYLEQLQKRPHSTATESPKNDSPASQNLSKKELRQLRAKERSARNTPERKRLRAQVERLEKQIAEGEERLAALTAELQQPGADYAAISKQIRDLQFDVSKQTLAWEDAAEKLELLDAPESD